MTEFAEIQRSLGRMEGKMDSYIETFGQRVEAIEEDAEALEKRVRSVEYWRWYLAGAIALGGAILGFMFA